MGTTYHNEQNPAIYNVIHFTPTLKTCWRWVIVIPAITLTGLQPSITGEMVNVGRTGITAWTGLPGAPSFDTRDAAIRWTELMGLPNVIAEI